MSSLSVAHEHHAVLLGGGHAHAIAMLEFARHRTSGLRVTLVSESRSAIYSGMLPGHLSGNYPRGALDIDLARLSSRCGANFIVARASGIDRVRRRLLLASGDEVAYDSLSIDVGSVTDLSGIKGADRFGIPLKPSTELPSRLRDVGPEGAGYAHPKAIVIVGGGAAGVEIAFALRSRSTHVHGDPGIPRIVVVCRSGLLPSLNALARSMARAALKRHDITVAEGFDVVEVTEQTVRARDGRTMPSAVTIVATGPRAPEWLAEAGLATAANGSILTRHDLSTLDDPAIFAVGDCATIIGAPREKAGVFAVRQGPVLAANLRRRAHGKELASYRPQRRHLTILSTSDGRAIASRGGWFALAGTVVWRWKHWIDCRFMAQFTST